MCLAGIKIESRITDRRDGEPTERRCIPSEWARAPELRWAAVPGGPLSAARGRLPTAITVPQYESVLFLATFELFKLTLVPPLLEWDNILEEKYWVLNIIG